MRIYTVSKFSFRFGAVYIGVCRCVNDQRRCGLLDHSRDIGSIRYIQPVAPDGVAAKPPQGPAPAASAPGHKNATRCDHDLYTKVEFSADRLGQV